MYQPLSNKLLLYSSLFITLVMSLPKLLIYQMDGPVARFVMFSPGGWILQVLTNFLFCICIFYYNRRFFTHYAEKWHFWGNKRSLPVNLLILVAFSLAGGFTSLLFFRSRLFLLNGFVIRLSISFILILIELKLLATLLYARKKEKENDQLRLANMSMELELLKAQLNPHFFFNALSSLSGVVREDPQKAQQYISHLSRIFRYSIHTSSKSMVTLREELDEIVSYYELMKMRHEGGFMLIVDADTRCYAQLLPHMSLQPLVENALKHNIATPEKPLTVSIHADSQRLEVRNNRQPKLSAMPGTGIGLANLNERFRILTNKQIEIDAGTDYFIVKLPF